MLYFGSGEAFASNSMKAIQGYHLIKPEDLFWRPSNLMRIPNADFLERTGSENLGARLWRLPPKSANTLHKHIRAEEFYFVLEGTGRLRVGDETLTVPRYGGVLVGPGQLRQVFNDTDAEVLWLIVGAPEELEFLPGAKTKPDMSLIYPVAFLRGNPHEAFIDVCVSSFTISMSQHEHRLPKPPAPSRHTARADVASHGL